MVLADSAPCVEAEGKRRAGERRHHQQDQGQLRHFLLETIQAFRTGYRFILSEALLLGLINSKPFQHIQVFKKEKNA